MIRKFISTITVLMLILSAALAIGAVMTPADVPEGFVAYVRASAGAFPGRGDIVWVKAGLNPTIPGFVPADQIPAIVQAAGGDVDGYLKNLVGNTTDPGLKPLSNRSTGEVIGYGWGGFTYNGRFNRITPPAEGGGGNGPGGGGSGGNEGGGA
jgi:hypothetical protein